MEQSKYDELDGLIVLVESSIEDFERNLNLAKEALRRVHKFVNDGEMEHAIDALEVIDEIDTVNLEHNGMDTVRFSDSIETLKGALFDLVNEKAG